MNPSIETFNGKSEFINRVNYAYLQTDGTIKYPNSYDGDALKIGYREIEELHEQIKRYQALAYQYIKAYEELAFKSKD